MSLKQTILAGTLLAALAAGGIAVAGAPDSRPLTAETTTYAVADAGTVTLKVAESRLELVEVAAAEGWQATIDGVTATEIEIDFVSVDSRLRFQAELEDGTVKVEVEAKKSVGSSEPTTTLVTSTTSTIPDTTSTTTPKAGSTTSTSVPSSTTTSTTIPDDDHGDDGLHGRLGVETYAAAEAGTVTVEHTASGLVLLAVSPAAGWEAEIDEARSDRVEIDFEHGESEVRFRLRVEADGRIELRIERKN